METQKAIIKLKKTSSYKYDEDNREYVENLEKDFEKAVSKRAFLDQDYVKEMVIKLKSILSDIRKRLVEEDDEMQRIKLKADRSAYETLLGWLSRDIDKQLNEINQKVNEILEET